MNLNALRFLYWITFTLSITALFLNVGIGLVALSIFIIPVLILHFIIGLHLSKLSDRAIMILISSGNLLLFALLRPDGVHSLNENGLSVLLNNLGMHGGYNGEYENELTIVSLVLLFIQVFIEIVLFRRSKKNKRV